MTFQGHDDLIDSRDVIEFLEQDPAGMDDDEQALYALAQEFTKQFEDYGAYCAEWSDGVTIIADSYFEDYAREIVEDCYDLKLETGNPYLDDCITVDWAKWAKLLKQDYTSAEVDGVTYWAG